MARPRCSINAPYRRGSTSPIRKSLSRTHVAVCTRSVPSPRNDVERRYPYTRSALAATDLPFDSRQRDRANDHPLRKQENDDGRQRRKHITCHLLAIGDGEVL